MKKIDIGNWKRKKHYEFFKNQDYPHFNICANVDITKLIKHLKNSNKSFFLAVIYLTARAANEIESFRYRMRGDEVIVHEKVNPAFTIMSEDEVFNFCGADFDLDFNKFHEVAKTNIKCSMNDLKIEDEEGVDDIIYMTSLPWVSFTSVTHPIHMTPVDCIPRIAWGKYFNDGDKIMMPLSVQVHHSLMDGLHVGRYFERLQELLDSIEEVI